MARDKAATGQRIRRKNDSVKHGPHTNKYAHLAPKPKLTDYNSEDKKWRRLPISGQPLEIVKAGLVVMFHGRSYILNENVDIPESGEAQLGLCKLKEFLD